MESANCNAFAMCYSFQMPEICQIKINQYKKKKTDNVLMCIKKSGWDMFMSFVGTQLLK